MKTAIALSALLLVGACAHTGLTGNGARKDVTTQMESAKDPLQTCYETALQKNRKLKGTIVVSFDAEPKTGKFKNVVVQRDDLGDPDLQKCVVTELGTLKLASPTSTKLAITYPINFSWAPDQTPNPPPQ